MAETRFTPWRALGLAALVACGCSAPSAPAPEPSPEPALPAAIDLAVPGALNRMPSIAVADRRVALVWTATVGDVMAVYAAMSEDAGTAFSPPLRISEDGERVSANAEQPPRVTMSGDTVTVIWPSRLDGRSAIRLSQSRDGGRTFGAPRSLTAAALTGLRGWQSSAPGPGNAVHAVWLDGRHAEPPAGGPHRHGARGADAGGHPRAAPRQDVYSAVIAPDGTSTESHVARDVCFCCKTAVGAGSGGRVFVAWRHIFPGSMRDIALAVSDDAGRTFRPFERVSHDEWQLSGCPDDGPSLAVDARGTAHIVWPTLVNGEAPHKAVFYSRTGDGKSFAARTRLSSETTEDAGHPQIAADAAGNVAAAWDEQAGDRRNVVVRIAMSGDGTFGPARTLTPGGSGFHPFVAGLERGFLVAWPDGSGERSAIRLQRIAR